MYILIWHTISELKSHYDTLGKCGFKHLNVQGLEVALSPGGSAVSFFRPGLEAELRRMQTQKL